MLRKTIKNESWIELMPTLNVISINSTWQHKPCIKKHDSTRCTASLLAINNKKASPNINSPFRLMFLVVEPRRLILSKARRHSTVQQEHVPCKKWDNVIIIDRNKTIAEGIPVLNTEQLWQATNDRIDLWQSFPKNFDNPIKIRRTNSFSKN